MSNKHHKKKSTETTAKPTPNPSSADTIASLLDADGAMHDEQMVADTTHPEDDLSVEPTTTAETHLPEEHVRTYQEQQAKIVSLEEELHKAHELFMRVRAEADNIKRRSEKAIADAHKFGLEKLAKQLLDVVDSLERALETDVQADDNALREGVQLTLDMLLATFSKFAIEVVDPAGETFDPQLHEAMVMQPDTDAASGTVLTVIQKGYVLNGRLIRPARVVVAK